MERKPITNRLIDRLTKAGGNFGSDERGSGKKPKLRKNMRLTQNVWLQDSKNPLFEIFSQANVARSLPRNRVLNAVHIVNPYNSPNRIHEQELAFASIKRARALARNSDSSVIKIFFLAAAFPEDCQFADRHFDSVVSLSQSALDLKTFSVPRKLPLLFDVIGAAREHAGNATHIIWTNNDICLAAGFYEAIAGLLALGFDAITVNRQDIPPIASEQEFLPLMEGLLGVRHRGFDCFIFPLDWVDNFVKTDALIGMRRVGRSLLYNLVAQAETMIMLNDVNLTFHVGSDKTGWDTPKFADYKEFNGAQARLIYPALNQERRERLRAFCHAYGERPEICGLPRSSQPSRPAFLRKIATLLRGTEKLV